MRASYRELNAGGTFVLQIPSPNLTRRKMRKSVLAGLAIAALTLTGCAAAEEEVAESVEETMVEEAPMEEAPAEEAPGTVVDVAVAAGTFTTLAAALEAAGLVETLQGEGPFTVFAPTDEAFAALPDGLLEALLLPENVDVLTAILTYHVVSGAVFAADVTTGDVATLEGSNIAIDTANGVVLNGSATVTAADVVASNGVIHVIDAVILPPGLDVTALLG
jgi:uncharacterized surface protein with fasciclin (FAS1) repeats